MTSRYALRFETGERRGERVLVRELPFTIGRRADNSLQVPEPSVSGRHAELRERDGCLWLVDLGSTNGSRIGGVRLTEGQLEPGAGFVLGNVGFVLEEVTVEREVPAVAAPEAASGPELDLAATTVQAPLELALSDEKLARARRAPRLGIVALALLLAAAAGGAWWWFAPGEEGGGRRVRPVEPVAGNLLARGYSFEDDQAGWSAREGAPVGFLADGAARVSGRQGLAADFGPDEWALHVSDPVSVPPAAELVLEAELSAEGAVEARVGLELLRDGADGEDGEDGAGAASAVAWSRTPEGAGGFETVELRLAVPPGFARVRALVLGRSVQVDDSGGDEDAGGRVRVDDVRLVSRTGGAPTWELDEHDVYALGDPPSSLVVVRVAELLLGDLAFRESAAPSGRFAPMEVRVEPDGLALSAAGGAPAPVLRLAAEAVDANGGVATMGEGGYQVHGLEFERAGVTDLLLGRGLELVRLRFEAPVAVRGRAEEGALSVRVQLGEAPGAFLQLRFREERAQAIQLAGSAADAEQRGDLGACLASWQELLDRYPFEESLVARAEETRSRLLLAGHAELREVVREVERARFFRLLDLFRECRSRCEDLAARYAGSEVAEAAHEQRAEIDGDLAGLEEALDRDEAARLHAILAALEAQDATALAGEVRSYLETHFAE